MSNHLNLKTMTNADLESLIDGLVEGTVEADNPLDLYDAALTERYRPGRADRVAALPLEAEPAPANVAALIGFAL